MHDIKHRDFDLFQGFLGTQGPCEHVSQRVINRLIRGQVTLPDHFLDKSIIACQLIQPSVAESVSAVAHMGQYGKIACEDNRR